MTTETKTGHGQASINGGDFYPAEVAFTGTFDMVRSETAVVPDPDWEHADSNGHLHAFAEKGETPTLTRYSVNIPCDGSCGGVCEGEGYDEWQWKCAICDEAVEPRFIPDVRARGTGIPVLTSRSATVTIRGNEALPQIGQVVDDNGNGTFTMECGITPPRVSLRVRTEDGEMIGTGYAGLASMEYSSRWGAGGWTVEITGANLLPRLGQPQTAITA